MSSSSSTGFAPTFSSMGTDGPVMRSMFLQRSESGGLQRSRAVARKSESYRAGSETLRSNESSLDGIPSQKDQRAEAAFSWKVLDHNVPAIPVHFPIMATHVTVVGESAGVIAERIEQCLGEWSVAARFNNQKAKVVAETAGRVRFCIRMFRDDNGDIIVEVQRRTNGGCLGFHDAALAILRAAQNLDFSQNGMRRLSPMVLAADSPIREEAKELNETCIEHAKDAMGCAERLLKSPRVDAQLLGAESLQLLTDANAVGEEVAAAAARAILSTTTDESGRCQVADGEDDADGEDEEDGGPATVTGSVKGMVEVSVDNGEDYDSFDQFEEGPLARYKELLHSHGLSIVTNSVSALSRSGGMKTILDDDKWYEETLLPVLLAEMAEANLRPHDAGVALRCLAILAECSNEFRNKALKEGVSHELAAMHKAGICRRHALLRQELETASAAFSVPNDAKRSPKTNAAVQ